MEAKDLNKYKMYPDRVKELTGVKADLYVFTRGQLEDFVKADAQSRYEEANSKVNEFIKTWTPPAHVEMKQGEFKKDTIELISIAAGIKEEK